MPQQQREPDDRLAQRGSARGHSLTASADGADHSLTDIVLPSMSERRMRSIWVYFLVRQDPLAARPRPDLSAPALPPSLGSAGSADRQDRTGWSRGDSRRSAVALGRPRTPQGAPRAPQRPRRQLGTRSRNPETVATSSTFGVTVGSGQVRKWRCCAVI